MINFLDHKLGVIYEHISYKITWLQFFKFAIVGGFGTILNLGLLHTFTERLLIPYWFAFPLSSLAAIISNYIWNSLWTFRAKPKFSGLRRYVATSILTITLYELILIALTDIGYYYFWSAMVAIGIGILLNFAFAKIYVWKMD